MEFRLKHIRFFGRNCSIICQNENGPCPLLAIANVLILQNRIVIKSDRNIISLNRLIQVIANQITDSAYKETTTSSNNDGDVTGISLSNSDAAAAETHEAVETALTLLPKLDRGLDLNIYFSQVNKFEYTDEICIFDILKVPLLHGWIADPKNEELVDIVGSLSYNHILYKAIEFNTLCESIPIGHDDKNISDVKKYFNGKFTCLDEKDVLIYSEGKVIDGFLKKSASQLTYSGILALYSFMNDRQLAVFFRNNHFSTIFFFNGQLFQLVTDQGYLYEVNVIWELLDGIDGIYGNSEFHNSDFEALIPETTESYSGDCNVPLNFGTIAMKSTSSDQSTLKSHSSTHNDSNFNMKQLSTPSSTQPSSSSSSSSSSQQLNDEVDQDLLLAQRIQQLENEGLAYGGDEYAVPYDNDYSQYISESEAAHANRDQEERDKQHAISLQYQEMNYNSPEEKRRKNTSNKNKNNNKCAIQ